MSKEDNYRKLTPRTANLLSFYLGKKINIKIEEGSVDMCKAWDDMVEEGVKKAEKEMIEKALKNGCTFEEIAKVMGITVDEIKNLI